MADQAEQAFARTFLNTLASQPVTFADDYQQRPENSLRRVPVLPIPVPEPPQSKAASSSSSSSSSSIAITIKSLKPAYSFSLQVNPTDTIAAVKELLAAQPRAPRADIQRLLLKGKALADAKLLREYTVKDGDTINLMLKPGSEWDPSSATATTTNSPTMSKPSAPLATPARRGHARIPSVVLSPSPSADQPHTPEKDILLTLDSASLPGPIQTEPLSTYGATVARPEFWERLWQFLQAEFTTPADALTAFEDFLRASKGSLTASQIARIRDHVGIVGMAGR
ncbi:hypothetical protein H0H81_003638 [Sphagnurus paluster]|uniref:Ubiquitin-like domain-containing protein n=1 Tax=Sphagnurus paluster TaxID=117069 RepID=A0A9P7FUU3_9AGAR|nr:hypothetical protein H0H81_003638 [Sphagnurus paluster]